MGPYREAAEDVEAAKDAAEVEAFKTVLARRGRRVRAGVLLVVLALVASVALVALVVVESGSGPDAQAPRVTRPRCETHLVTPPSGEPFPMTVCR